MFKNDHENDFAYVREMLDDIFLRMADEPLACLHQGVAMQRNLSDIQWMLNHGLYPTPGQVNFVISLLRNEKFRVANENAGQTELSNDIQLMINQLKDMHRFLLLSTNYDWDGDIIRVESGAGWGGPEWNLFVAYIFILCVAQCFLLLGYSSWGVYFGGLVLFFITSLMLKNKMLIITFFNLVIFTLCIFSS